MDITQIIGSVVLLLGMIGMFLAGYGYGYQKAQHKDSEAN